MPQQWRALQIVLLFLLGVSVLAQNESPMTPASGPDGVPICYFPDQTVATGNYACNLASNVSACCGTGGICLDNGLCGTSNNEIIRGACTDKSWTSDDCPQYCLGADTGGTDLISCQNVTKSNLDYCCDHTNNCCETGVGRFRLNSAALPFATLGAAASMATRLPFSSSPTSSGTSSSSTSAISSSTSSPAKAANESTSQTTASASVNTTSGLSSGAKAGIGAGVASGAIIVLALAIWLLRRRKATQHMAPQTTPQGDMGQESQPMANEYHKPTSGPALHELSGERHHEMPAQNQAWELPGQT